MSLQCNHNIQQYSSSQQLQSLRFQMNTRRHSPSSFHSKSINDSLVQAESSDGLVSGLEDVYKLINMSRNIVRKYRGKKQNTKEFDDKQIEDLSKYLRDGSHKLKTIIEAFPKLIDTITSEKSKQLSNVRVRNTNLIEQIRFKQSQYNKKIMEMQQESNKKLQQYQSLINKFVGSMIQARKKWSEFEDRCNQLVVMMSEKNEMEEEARLFYETIISMIHSVSTKNSVNDSNIDHTCQMSSIMRHEVQDDLLEQQSNFDEDDHVFDVDMEVRKIEQSLKHLVTRGFFNQQNKQIICQFCDINKLFSWQALTYQDFYTTLLQFCREGLMMPQQSIGQEYDQYKTVMQYQNQESSSQNLMQINQQRYFQNFQQKAEDSIMDLPSEINKDGSEF